MEILIFNIVFLAVVAGGVRFWWVSQKEVHNFHHTLGIAFLIFTVGVLVAIAAPTGIFFKMQLMTWVMFLHIPLFFAVVSLMLVRRKCKWTYVVLGISLGIIAIGVDAVMVEPNWLEVTHYEISTDKLAEPVRIAVVADVQTDAIDEFEREMLRKVKEAEPDLVLLAGDYIQIYDKAEYRKEADKLRVMLVEAGLKPRYGIYAVEGNHDDGKAWKEIFAGTDVNVMSYTDTVKLGELSLTCLKLEDSFDTGLEVEGAGGFHIVLGHSPNFSLGDIDADLLVAGHTHGGQVQMPFVGPLITFSSVPRDWASGMTEIAAGRYLFVSRGLGMEQNSAPRIRFFCRPELAIINLLVDDTVKSEE